MPRGKLPSLDRPEKKKINLPSSLVARVDLLLYSELEQKVPHAAWSKLIQQLLGEWLEKVEQGAQQ